MRTASAASLGFDALVRLFNEGYAGYVVPVRLGAEALRFALDVADVDLEASRVAWVDGEPAAFALVALRGAEAYVAGMGTVPSRRRRGHGEAVLRAALQELRRRGAATVRLEVIEANVAAIGLYEKLGFERTRDLEVWALDAAADPGPRTHEADAAEALAWIRAHRPSEEPWQRADRTLERLAERGEISIALVASGRGARAAAAVYGTRGGLASIRQAAAIDERAAADVLAAVAAREGGLRFLNAPAGEPASLALRALGGRIEVRQHELRLDLEVPRRPARARRAHRPARATVSGSPAASEER